MYLGILGFVVTLIVKRRYSYSLAELATMLATEAKQGKSVPTVTQFDGYRLRCNTGVVTNSLRAIK